MLPEEWPIAAPAADQNAPARLAGRDRLSTVRTDFFLHPEERLTEQERALMTAMLHCLVGDIAEELRAVGSRAASHFGERPGLARLARGEPADELLEEYRDPVLLPDRVRAGLRA